MANKRDKDDPRNQLYKYTIDVIRRIKPECFYLEKLKEFFLIK